MQAIKKFYIISKYSACAERKQGVGGWGGENKIMNKKQYEFCIVTMASCSTRKAKFKQNADKA